MIKVFEHNELSRVGQLQSLLETEGIRTHIKNEFTNSAFGEILFTKAIPELWILDDDDLVKAKGLLAEVADFEENPEPEWTCAGCDSVVDGVFGRCWKCNAQRPESGTES